MKPFPKWITLIGLIGGSAGAVYTAWQTKDWFALIAGVGAVLAGFGHSVTGTGGKAN